MTERPRPAYGDQADYLATIKIAIEDGTQTRAQLDWLVAEVHRLREAVELRDAYIRAIGADVDKAVALGAKYLGWE